MPVQIIFSYYPYEDSYAWNGACLDTRQALAGRARNLRPRPPVCPAAAISL